MVRDTFNKCDITCHWIGHILNCISVPGVLTTKIVFLNDFLKTLYIFQNMYSLSYTNHVTTHSSIPEILYVPFHDILHSFYCRYSIMIMNYTKQEIY